MAQATIPGPTGLDMVRGIRQMREHPPEFLADCATRFGHVVQFPIPRACVVYLSSPDDVMRVLQGNHRSYTKETVQYRSLALVTGSGLLTTDGETWRRMRRTLQPAFHTRMVAQMFDAVQQPVAELTSRIATQGELRADLDELMLELSLDVVGMALFGRNFGRETRQLATAVSDALNVVVKRAQQPLRTQHWLPSPGARRLERSMSSIDQSVGRLIREGVSETGTAGVLGVLLSARDAGEVTDAEVRNEIVTLIVAGHETVAATMTWTWLLLAAHPQIMRAVREEVDELPAPPWDGGIAEQLPLMRAVVDECLRLYPPAWAISRRSLTPDVIGGYAIPAGATVITSPYALHRDRRLWPDPLTFRPERFLNRALDRSVLLPFGAGPHLCIGREMALLEATVVLARMVREVEVELRPHGPVGKKFGVTLRPNIAIPARLTPRLGIGRVDRLNALSGLPE